MVFNTATFGVFLVLVFFFYWFVFRRSLRRQNLLLVVVSYIFYGWWDWRFLGLLLISSMFDFFIGIAIENADTPRRKKGFLYASLFVNLSLLGFFKYFNFFVDSFIDAFGYFGVTLHGPSLEIILPVGISFYTFQELSYTIDIYRGKLKATRDPVAFLAFVSFFPQLVAGPIERAANLLPQFYKARVFVRDMAVAGLRLMLWGFFKKVVIADNCARFVDPVYGHPENYTGTVLLVATFLFTIQVYCDFSGYSDIARGCARLFGFELMKNFDRPFFSTSIREFWRRWHISLSSWFKDYIYFPLGGSKNGLVRTLLNLMIIFIISGLWHGAEWKFVIWGIWLGLFICFEQLLQPARLRIPAAVSMLLVFSYFMFALVFFRASSLQSSVDIFHSMVTSFSLQQVWQELHTVYSSLPFIVALLLLIAGMFIVERKDRRIVPWLVQRRRPVRWMVYYSVLLVILLLGVFDNTPNFVYFQF